MKLTKTLTAASLAALMLFLHNERKSFATNIQTSLSGSGLRQNQNREHYKPAFIAAIEEAKAEIQLIADNTEEPTFANTIEPLNTSGRTLNTVAGIFFNLNQACTNAEMQKIAEEVAPMMTEYSMSIILNPVLFQKVKAVYEMKDSLQLNQEQAKLLEESYKSFTRNGANLPDDKKAEYARLQEELSITTLTFGRNVLNATNAYILNITDEADLAGLPDYVREMAAADAQAKGKEGWVFTLDQPSYSPFLKYSTRRELREQIWKAYNSKCIGGEFDNTANIRKIVDLRIHIAQLLGYETYADYALEDRMAKNPATVNNFLADLMQKSLPFARRDVAEIQAYAKANGFEEQLMPWDFSYWSEKFQEERYSLNEELLKPYFELSSVQAAIFDLAERLYGLKFEENPKLPYIIPT